MHKSEKAQHAILRFAKYKGPTISRIEAHNERTKEFYASNPDIKTELSKYNFHLMKSGGKYREEANRLIKETGCEARKDSVRMVETLITASPDFECGESASITGRTHIPPRIFKQTIRLNKQREQLEKLISELNTFNSAKKMPVIKALMAKMLPTAEKLHTYMNRAKATEKELEAEIAALEKEVTAGKVSVLKQLELRQQVQKLSALEQTLLDMQRTMDAIPPEIIASYKAESERKETVHREER